MINKNSMKLILKLSLKDKSIKLIYKYPEITDKIKLPIDPEYVLLGLITVNFGPLKVLPKTNPPISLNAEIVIVNRKNNKFSFLKIQAEITEKVKKIIPKSRVRDIFLLQRLYHSKKDIHKIIKINKLNK